MTALKAVIAAIVAGLVVLDTVLSRGSSLTLTPADWQTVITAALGPLLVYLVPNTAAKPPEPAAANQDATRTS